MTSRQAIDHLCLKCGLCCNGALFRDVELQPQDRLAVLRGLGLPIATRQTTTGSISKLPQPCAALCADLKCRIYLQRPKRCREFECALLRRTVNTPSTIPAALAIIKRTRRLLEKIDAQLRFLGIERTDWPLKKRFQSAQRHFENKGLDSNSAATFADLSQHYHRLNILLASHFLSVKTR